MSTFQLISPSALEIRTPLGGGQTAISKHNLDERVGNTNGKFSTADRNFSHSSRNTRIEGCTLYAELRRVDASWVEDSIKLDFNLIRTLYGWTQSLRVGGVEKMCSTASMVFTDAAFKTRPPPKEYRSFRRQDESRILASDLDGCEHYNRYIDLDLQLGNNNGTFDKEGVNFSASARNVFLNGVMLHADLQKKSGEWVRRSVSLSWLHALWRLNRPAYNPDSVFYNGFELTPWPSNFPPLMGIQVSVPGRDLSTVHSRVMGATEPLSIPLYESLPLGAAHFRLCRIQPNKWDAPIQCQMVTSPIDQAGIFTALSYVWGSPDDKCTIFVNSRAVLVTRELFDALRMLRWHGMAEPVWIDALCINQEDDDEKNFQVSIMADIYTRAQQVMIWLNELGPHNPRSVLSINCNPPRGLFPAIAATFFRSLARGAHIYDAILASTSTNGIKFSHCDPQLLSTFLVEACFRFADSPWFHRTWTIQEYVRAKDVAFFFSHELIAYDTVQDAMWNFARHAKTCCAVVQAGAGLADSGQTDKSNARLWHLDFVRAVHQVHARMINVRTSKEVSRILHQSHSNEMAVRWHTSLLQLMRERRCTDPRDRIFAFVNVTAGAFGSFSPDYRKTFTEVYTEYTVRAIHMSRNLDIWCVKDRGGETTLPGLATLPSWAIDWTKGGDDDPLCRLWRRYLFDNAAPGDTHAAFEGPIIRQNGMMLTIRASQFDIIDGVGAKRAPAPQLSPDCLKLWMAFAGINNVKSIPDDSERWEIFWRTLIGERVPSDEAYRGPNLFVEMSSKVCWRSPTSADGEHLKDLMTEPQLASGDFPFTELSRQVQLVQARVDWNLAGRRPFKTIGGRLELCGPQVEPGDLLFHVMGCRWPVVLRPCAADHRQDPHLLCYRLIEVCFVRGLTSSEVNAALEKGYDVCVC